MGLTSVAVQECFYHCLQCEPEEETVITPIVVTRPFKFSHNKIKERKGEIQCLLGGLPAAFHTPMGMLFAQACNDREGRQWGDHLDMERLFALGMAAGEVERFHLGVDLGGDIPIVFTTFMNREGTA